MVAVFGALFFLLLVALGVRVARTVFTAIRHIEWDSRSDASEMEGYTSEHDRHEGSPHR